MSAFHHSNICNQSIIKTKLKSSRFNDYSPAQYSNTIFPKRWTIVNTVHTIRIHAYSVAVTEQETYIFQIRVKILRVWEHPDFSPINLAVITIAPHEQFKKHKLYLAKQLKYDTYFWKIHQNWIPLWRNGAARCVSENRKHISKYGQCPLAFKIEWKCHKNLAPIGK